MCCIYQKNNNSFLFKISKGIHRKNVHQQELHRIRLRIISYISSEDMHFGLYGSGSIKDFNFFNFFFSLTLGKHGNLFSDLIPLLKWAKKPASGGQRMFWTGQATVLYTVRKVLADFAAFDWWRYILQSSMWRKASSYRGKWSKILSDRAKKKRYKINFLTVY